MCCWISHSRNFSSCYYVYYYCICFNGFVSIIHNAGFVNQLSKNHSMTLEIQEDTDVKMEHKSYALYDVIQSLGDELQV